MTIFQLRRIYFRKPHIQNDVNVSVTLILRKCFLLKPQQNTKMHHITVDDDTHTRRDFHNTHEWGVVSPYFDKSDVVPVARHFNACHSFNNQINANCQKPPLRASHTLVMLGNIWLFNCNANKIHGKIITPIVITSILMQQWKVLATGSTRSCEM